MNSVYPVSHAAPADLSAVMPVDHQSSANLDDWYGSMMNGRGTGDWYGSMMGMGGLTASIASLTSGEELDKLARAVSKLHDALTASYDQVNALKKQEALAEKNAPQYGPPAPGDDLYVNYLSAMNSITEGYKALTGFDYMTTVISNVFTPNAAKLSEVYGGLSGLLGSIRNWNDTWQRQIGASHPEMVTLWDHIQNRHMALYAAATGKPVDYDDPKYLATAQQAVQELTGVTPEAAGSFGMGDFGISALIAVIVITVGAVAIAIALVKLAGQFNAVANNIAGLRKDYEATMAKRHDDYVKARIAAGASVQQAEQEWLAIKQQADAQQAAKEDELAKKAPGIDLTKILTYGGIVVGGAIALPHLLKAVGVGDVFGIGELLGLV